MEKPAGSQPNFFSTFIYLGRGCCEHAHLFLHSPAKSVQLEHRRLESLRKPLLYESFRVKGARERRESLEINCRNT